MSKDNWFYVLCSLQLAVMSAFLYVACEKLDLIVYLLENAQ